MKYQSITQQGTLHTFRRIGHQGKGSLSSDTSIAQALRVRVLHEAPGSMVQFVFLKAMGSEQQWL